MISIQGVNKRYGSKTILNDITFRIEEGEFCALLGPNGAGKTSIIRLLLNFTRPTSGEITINGIPVSAPHSRSIVGYVAESPRIPPYLTGEQYLQRQISLFNSVQARECEPVPDILRLVNMSGKEKAPIKTYSKGMVQRIALGGALLCKPRFLILDEPTSGLDPIGIREIRTILEKCKEQNTTLLLSSHILSEVERVCTTAIILYNGKIAVKDSIPALIKDNENLEDVFVRVVQEQQ